MHECRVPVSGFREEVGRFGLTCATFYEVNFPRQVGGGIVGKS